jgi:hypothetical protein
MASISVTVETVPFELEVGFADRAYMNLRDDGTMTLSTNLSSNEPVTNMAYNATADTYQTPDYPLGILTPVTGTDVTLSHSGSGDPLETNYLAFYFGGNTGHQGDMSITFQMAAGATFPAFGPLTFGEFTVTRDSASAVTVTSSGEVTAAGYMLFTFDSTVFYGGSLLTMSSTGNAIARGGLSMIGLGTSAPPPNCLGPDTPVTVALDGTRHPISSLAETKVVAVTPQGDRVETDATIVRTRYFRSSTKAATLDFGDNTSLTVSPAHLLLVPESKLDDLVPSNKDGPMLWCSRCKSGGDSYGSCSRCGPVRVEGWKPFQPAHMRRSTAKRDTTLHGHWYHIMLKNEDFSDCAVELLPGVLSEPLRRKVEENDEEWVPNQV